MNGKGCNEVLAGNCVQTGDCGIKRVKYEATIVLFFLFLRVTKAVAVYPTKISSFPLLL
jgi:hypothetical protein